ncbi:hypothetical protein [Cognatishimia sp. MH4019]|uniref:hypothetical protein n=1 Tax=Cognatishimia sp. MH4019 TaxID=2854030 RepID=UPI001CD1F80C|nr:hypothetical protein [Cognatishimia sp. MH4019]
MTAHDPSAFLKIDTPSNACTVTDRALREAFRASMDAPQEKAGLLDQLNARIAALKSAPKAAPPAEAEPATADMPDPVETPVQAEAPQDEEGSLFAHLNEIMEEKPAPAAELKELEAPTRSKSVIMRAVLSILPKKKAKAAPAPKAEAKPKAQSGSIILRALSALKPKAKAQPTPEPAPTPEPQIEDAPKAKSGSVILRALSALKPKPKAPAEPKAAPAAKVQSGSVVLKLLKAISPIKRTS